LHQAFLIYKKTGFLDSVSFIDLSKDAGLLCDTVAMCFFRAPLCFLFSSNTRFDFNPYASFISGPRLRFLLGTTTAFLFCSLCFLFCLPLRFGFSANTRLDCGPHSDFFGCARLRFLLSPPTSFLFCPSL
jgi:hypothetical protein